MNYATFLLGTEIYDPFEWDSWKQFCNTVADMPGLEEFHIWIDNGGCAPGNPVAESKILNPLRVIRRVRDFKVYLTWTPQYDYDNMPFQLGSIQWPTCWSRMLFH